MTDKPKSILERLHERAAEKVAADNAKKAAASPGEQKVRSRAHEARMANIEGRAFQPGNQLARGRGRPPGTRNKFGEAFIAAMQEDFEKNGDEVIQAVRTEKPDVYLKICASIVPQEIKVSVNRLESLTDEQLQSNFNRLASALGLVIGTDGNGAGNAPTQGAQPATKLQTLQ